MAETGTATGPGYGVRHRVAKTGPDVHAALGPGLRERFAVEFRAALAAADSDFDLQAVERVVDRWWPRALLCANPDLQRGIDDDRGRLDRGDRSVLGAITTAPHA